MATSCLIPGAFDPLHYGHVSLIERACRQFDDVFIALVKKDEECYDEGDAPLLTMHERIKLIETFFDDKKNVFIVYFRRPDLIEICKKYKIKTIIRGIRDLTDYREEERFNTHIKNKTRSIEVAYYLSHDTSRYTNKNLWTITSTEIRKKVRNGEDVKLFVPSVVRDFLVDKYDIKVPTMTFMNDMEVKKDEDNS